MLKSLDPRINRLEIPERWGSSFSNEQMDQLPTFEVFVQAKEGRPFQHEGVVHASDEEMALVFAKEQFSRRNSCSGIWVVRTENIQVTPFTENSKNIYEEVGEELKEEGEPVSYDVFHLIKRGKQHKHAGSVEANGPHDALVLARKKFYRTEGPVIYNVWIAASNDILRTAEEDQVIWETLPEKSFRDAIAYKVSDKLKEYKESKKS